VSTEKTKAVKMIRSARELEALTADLDQEFIVDTFKPLSRRQRARWERIKRKRGRPKVGRGAEVISVSVERELLARADRLAARLAIPRAALIARGLRAALALSGDGTGGAPRGKTARRPRRTA
jgi:hypothetical protein